MGFTPSEMFLTRGVGHRSERLASMDEALRDADIARFNLVKASSIFPPHCKVISRKKGLGKLQSGQMQRGAKTIIGGYRCGAWMLFFGS